MSDKDKEDFISKFQCIKSTEVFNEYEYKSSDHKVVIFTFWIDNPVLCCDEVVRELPNYGYSIKEVIVANWEVITIELLK